MSERSSAPKDARRRLLRALAKELGHEFSDLEHLDRALTHASTGNEGKRNYERLEFLGDAILNFAVADALFQQQPEIPEGQLTETRSHYVSRKPLAAIARAVVRPSRAGARGACARSPSGRPCACEPTSA